MQFLGPSRDILNERNIADSHTIKHNLCQKKHHVVDQKKTETTLQVTSHQHYTAVLSLLEQDR